MCLYFNMKKILIFLEILIILFSLNLIIAKSNVNQQVNQKNIVQSSPTEITLNIEQKGENLQISNKEEITNRERVRINNEGKNTSLEIKERIRLRKGNITAYGDVNITIEEDLEKNQTKLYAILSNGKKSEIKIMPDTAAEIALERLRLKVCNETNNCTIILKETGQKNQTRLTYEIEVEKHLRILGIFKKKAKIKAQVDAETSQLIIKKPWWAFLSKEE